MSGTIEPEQEEAVRFLADPDTHGGAEVTEIVTHISHLFLAGDLVYKLKRALRLPYADFSSLALRRAACETETDINRRTAPALYLRAAAVTRAADGSLALGGAGAPVDWVTVMRRFPQDDLFDRLAARGALDGDLAEATARAVAAMHEAAPPAGEAAAEPAAVVAGIVAELRTHQDILPAEKVAAVATALDAALQAGAPLLAARKTRGLVRDVHGDLHLGNIVLLDGAPTPFDAIEFDARLRRIDVFYDAAFLVMDLLHRRLGPQAARFLSAYLDACDDAEGLALLPLFMAMRAGIRAHVTAQRARGLRDDGGADAIAAAADLAGDAESLLDLALACLTPRRPILVAVGGLSGTGKTTLARDLAPDLGPLPGAVVLRSDEIRKQLAGVPPAERLAQRWYTPAISAKVFRRLASRAAAILAAGHGVIADGVYGESARRREIADVAGKLGLPFRGLWLSAETEVRAARVDGRRGDASDATADVARSQTERPPAEDGWTRLHAGDAAAATAAAARRALDLPGPGA